MSRRVARAVLRAAAAGIAVVGVALTGTTADAAPPRADLPPAELADLAKLFRKDVAPLGLEISRGMLQNPETYRPDPNGTHLALYAEPTSGDYTSADYVRNFTKLTHRFIPKVFKRWKGLETFDICQEPFADTREAPPPVTQIFVARRALDRVDNWRTATLTELLAAAPREQGRAADYFVYFAPSVRDDPTLAAAAREAGWTIPQSPFGR